VLTLTSRLNRNAIVPLWLALFGLLALLWSPVTAVTGTLLLTVGVVGATTMLVLLKDPPAVAVPHRVEASGAGH
jgi:hypothetical protein